MAEEMTSILEFNGDTKEGKIYSLHGPRKELIAGAFVDADQFNSVVKAIRDAEKLAFNAALSRVEKEIYDLVYEICK